MMFKTHLAFSILVVLLILIFFDIPNKIIFVFVIALSSSFPDIDSDKSKIGRKLPLISKIINLIFGHRKFFHSVFIPLILFLALYTIDFYISLAIFIGYLTHLLGDSITNEGIMPFYPLSKFNISGLLKTNSILEFLLFLTFSSLSLFLLYKIYL